MLIIFHNSDFFLCRIVTNSPNSDINSELQETNLNWNNKSELQDKSHNFSFFYSWQKNKKK